MIKHVMNVQPMADFLLEQARNRRLCPECHTHNNVSGNFTLVCLDCETVTERNPDMRDLPCKEVSNGEG